MSYEIVLTDSSQLFYLFIDCNFANKHVINYNLWCTEIQAVAYVEGVVGSVLK